jgi:two-component system chemotaxis sensor kinase CheA
MQVDMQRFHAAFFEEVAEHLTAMETGLLALEHMPDDRETLHTIFRAAHSIKGASGTFGFNDVAHFTHDLESLLDRLREGRTTLNGELIELLLRSSDALGGLVAAAKANESPPDVDALLNELRRAQGDDRTAPPPPTSTANHRTSSEYVVRFRPGADILRFGMDPLLILRDLASLGDVDRIELDVSRLPPLAELSPEQCCLAWTLRLRTTRPLDDVRAVFMFVEDVSEVVIEAAAKEEPMPVSVDERDRAAAKPARSPVLESSSIRVSVEKVDELINLAGELVIAHSMVNQALSEMPREALPVLQEALDTMSRSVRDIQEHVMGVRMVPLATVFRRFPRLVRDLSTNLGKQIRVDICGEDTELDKQVIERIGDPLTHLVRNAIDHGIGSPEERIAAGKPAEGRLCLRAFQEGANVVIEVADDGRGLDAERIRRKAVAQGLIGPDEALSEEQIHNLIFAPGLSTAEKVSDVSGRGVGMDVVKQNVEALNGSTRIRSQRGEGTTLQIRLPLTMAIVEGLAVALDRDLFILPLLAVVESLQPTPSQVRTIPGQGDVVVVRGEVVPLLRLHQALSVAAVTSDPCQGLVVFVENHGAKLGLLVDEVVGQMQVVMKNLETNYRKVEGIAGATILGDGQVAFILDVAGLARLAGQGSGASSTRRNSPPARLAPENVAEDGSPASS